MLRQLLLICVSAAAALVVLILVTVVSEALGATGLSGWFAHGNFVLPWGFLTILIYITAALINDRRSRR